MSSMTEVDADPLAVAFAQMWAAQQRERDLRKTLEATETVLNRRLMQLAEASGEDLKHLCLRTYKEIREERRG